MSSQPNVHHCLKVPELFSAICRHSKDLSLLQLSLTCRSFFPDALDALWYEPKKGIPALLHCFPDGVIHWERRTCFSLRRTPRAHEWDRVRLYASRIRVLRLDEGPGTSTASLKCYRLFLDHWPYDGQVMFPNMHSAWLLSSLSIGSEICTAAARARPLRNMEILFEQQSRSINSDLNKMNKCFAVSHDTLKSLVLCALDLWQTPRAEIADSIGNAVCTLTALEKISFREFPLSSKAIAYLALLPSLTALSFQYVSDYANPQYLSPNDNNFRHLTILELVIDESQMLGTACTMLANVHPAALENLSIAFYQVPLASYLIKLVRAAARFTSLHSLALECEVDEKYGSWISRDPKNWPIPCSHIFNALISLRKLRSLSIRGLRLRITPVDIGGLTHLWPELQVLHLTADREYTTVRIADLHLLGAECSRLHTVELPLLGGLRTLSTRSEAVPTYENRRIRRFDAALYSSGGACRYIKKEHLEALRCMFPEAEIGPNYSEEELNMMRSWGPEEDSGTDGSEGDWNEEEDLEFDEEY